MGCRLIAWRPVRQSGREAARPARARSVTRIRAGPPRTERSRPRAMSPWIDGVPLCRMTPFNYQSESDFQASGMNLGHVFIL